LGGCLGRLRKRNPKNPTATIAKATAIVGRDHQGSGGGTELFAVGLEAVKIGAVDEVADVAADAGELTICASE